MELSQDIQKEYKHWRIRILYGMYGGYVIFYLTRKSFSFVTPVLMQKLHFTAIEIGLISTLFYIIYGVSKFFTGVVSDRANPKYFMAIGLFMTGVINIIFGLSTSIPFLIILWSFNAFFQGWGWPPCAKLLTHWYSKNERGRWWAIWNTSHNIGGALIPIIIALILYFFPSNWRMGMIIPGIIGIIVSIFVFNRLCDVPEKRGLPKIENFRNDYSGSEKEGGEKIPLWDILTKYVFKNKYMWLLAISYTLVYVVRTAFNDWGAVYLHQNGHSIVSSDSVMSLFEVGGFFGALLAGWGSDVIFKGLRGPVNVIFGFGIFIVVLLFFLVPLNNIYIYGVLIFLVGFMIFGPQMLIGVAAAEWSHREAAGASTGFQGLFGYIGAAISGAPIGFIIQNYGWNIFFLTLLLCALISTIVLIPMWSVVKRPNIKGVDF